MPSADKPISTSRGTVSAPVVFTDLSPAEKAFIKLRMDRRKYNIWCAEVLKDWSAWRASK